MRIVELPQMPEELTVSRKAELIPLTERAKLREYGETLREEAERHRAADEAEWRRIRVPVGIIWRDPRDLQGLGGSVDPLEQELLSRVFREMRQEGRT